jgi:alpha-tubulin suppressor-like RCC1 family protein
MTTTNVTTNISAGGEHTLIQKGGNSSDDDRIKNGSSSSSLWSTGACGLGWCRNYPLSSALYRLRKVEVDDDSDNIDNSIQHTSVDTHFSHFYASYYHNLGVGATTGRLYTWGCGTFTDNGDQHDGSDADASSSPSLDGVKPALGQGSTKVFDLGQGPRPVVGLEHLTHDHQHEQQQQQPNDYIRQISGGAYHSIVLTAYGHVYTFGAGQLGQLGRPISSLNRDASTTANPTTDSGVVADASGLPVDPIPQQVVGIPPTEFVSRIGSSFYNTFAICQKSGHLYCAGENQNHQCGRGRGLGRDKTGGQKNANNNLFTMTKVEELDGQHVDQAEGGYCHTLIKTITGKVFSMGCSEEGQRGVGRIVQDSDNEDGSVDDGTHYGSLPTVTPVPLPAGQKATQVAAGANHSLVLAEDGTVYAFGSNDVGQCGVVDPYKDETCASCIGEDEGEPVWKPTKVDIPEQAGRAVQVSAGYAHSVVSTEMGKVFVFGQNDNGQLGMGDTNADEPVLTPTELNMG